MSRTHTGAAGQQTHEKGHREGREAPAHGRGSQQKYSECVFECVQCFLEEVLYTLKNTFTTHMLSLSLSLSLSLTGTLSGSSSPRKCDLLGTDALRFMSESF